MNFITYSIEKIKEKGFFNIFALLAKLISEKISVFVKQVHICMIVHVVRPVNYALSHGSMRSKVLYAFYDRSVNPTTFDFVIFLVLAELERIKKGCEKLHIVFAGYEREEGHKKETDEFIRFHNGTLNYNSEFFQWRLQNILLPCCHLFGSVSGITVSADRNETRMIEQIMARHVFPQNYTVNYPVSQTFWNYIAKGISDGHNIPSLEVPEQALHYAKEWIRTNCKDRKIITISLREASYNLSRNSDIASWGKFIDSIDNNVYCPVIIRDTEAAFHPGPGQLEGQLVFHEASWNLLLRAAIYRLSYLNLMVSNGPAILCILNNKTRYIIFKVIADSVVATREFLKSREMFYGEQLQTAVNESQRIVWEDDSYEVLSREFSKMCRFIDSQPRKSKNDQGTLN